MKKLVIKQGKTFLDVVRWETDHFIYKAITGITKAAPVVITSVAHGLTDGWRVAVVSVNGMRQINAAHDVLEGYDWHPVTVIDSDHISINDINASSFSTYTSGGYLQFYTPHDLTSYTARMSIKDRIGGTELLSLTTENGGITIDASAKTITRTITAAVTAALTWTNGVYDMELVSPSEVVPPLGPDSAGSVTVKREVTT